MTETRCFVINIYRVGIEMSMLRSAILRTVHSRPTLSPHVVGMKGCHKPSTSYNIRQVNI